MSDSPPYIIRPNPADPRLTERVSGLDQTGARIETSVTVERALTIFLNSQEIVTAMTINDYPEYLALGYLLNQHMLLPDDEVTAIDYDEELAVVVVRTKRKTNYEKKLKKKVQTSGCAQGTVFGDLIDAGRRRCWEENGAAVGGVVFRLTLRRHHKSSVRHRREVQRKRLPWHRGKRLARGDLGLAGREQCGPLLLHGPSEPVAAVLCGRCTAACDRTHQAEKGDPHVNRPRPSRCSP
jgi:hypothetical protein